MALIVPPVASAKWLPPVDVSQPGENGFLGQAPQLAVDASGGALAVWAQVDLAGYVAQASTRAPGGGWGAPVDLSAAGETAIEPRVAMNAAGHAVAVWVHLASQRIVKAASRTPEGGWGPAEPISIPGHSATDLDVAIDPAGNAVAVWTQYDETSDYIVEAATKAPGGQWTTPVELSQTGNNAWSPKLAVDASGRIVAVWSRWTSAGDVIVQATEKQPGQAWSSTKNLSPAGFQSWFPVVKVGGDRTVVAWETDEDDEEVGDKIIEAAIKEAGGPWQESEEISEPGSRFPRLGMDSQGNALALWSGEWVGGLVPEVATLASGGTWTDPVPLTEPQPVDGLQPELAVDPAGRAMVTWRSPDDGVPEIEAVTGTVGGGWGTPVTVSPPEAWSRYPQVALDGAGNGAAVWQVSSKDGWINQAAVFDATDPELGPISAPAAGRAGRPIAFALSPFDRWSPISSVTWTFGDGSTAVGPQVAHTFGAPGQFNVTVTAVDGAGHSTTASTRIDVSRALAASNRLVTVKRGRARLTLHCVGTAECSGGAKLTRRTAGKKGAKRNLSLTRYFAFTIPPESRKTIATKLKPAALKLLRAAGRKGLRAQLAGDAVEPRGVVLRSAVAPKPKRRR